MAPAGLEPAASRLGIVRSIRVSYGAPGSGTLCGLRTNRSEPFKVFPAGRWVNRRYTIRSGRVPSAARPSPPFRLARSQQIADDERAELIDLLIFQRSARAALAQEVGDALEALRHLLDPVPRGGWELRSDLYLV